MRIEWLSSAEDDTDNIVDHLNSLNPIAARLMISRIQNAVEKLQAHPFIGRRGNVAATRELVVLRTPYIVIYSVESDHIVVKRVLHTSRQWPPEEQ